VNNSDERDHAEEQANRAEMQEEDHCIRCDSSSDDYDPAECICCPCCCECLACEYGPKVGVR
jgi:hypothetical protein